MESLERLSRSEPVCELVGPPLVATGATGKQIELLFLDPVLHVPAGTTELVIQVFRVTLEISHHIPTGNQIGHGMRQASAARSLAALHQGPSLPADFVYGRPPPYCA